MILETIAASSHRRAEAAKRRVSEEEMRARAKRLPHNDFRFERALRMQQFGLICEIKRASPSNGVLTEDFRYIDIACEYEEGGAAAVSVLTEPEFFLGSGEILTEVRAAVEIPVLRKDFIVEEYQLYESKVMGADAVLLIAALFDRQTLMRHIGVCEDLGMSALVEAHTGEEVRTAVEAGAQIVGINNRDLRTFEVDLGTSVRLRPLVPEKLLCVAESGIRSPQDIKQLYEAGIHAALVGETLMRSPNRTAEISLLRRGISG